jgi:tetratricopeptide (TPR) repeat protein
VKPKEGFLAGLAILLLSGCVYYNGMYNANRLARSARKAEREGRTLEASGLWGQVITRAESVSVRHPDSKYADQAAVLRGVALARLGQCGPAVAPLGHAALLAPGTELAEEGTLALGRCSLEAGDADAADLAFTRVIESRDPERRREARLQHARVLRLGRRYQEAVTLLKEANDPRAREDLFLALAGAGRTAEAFALADTLIAHADSTRSWDALIDTLGQQNPANASTMVDRLIALRSPAPPVRARWLLQDADRLALSDSARATARLQQAVQVGGKTLDGRRARLRLTRRSLARVRSVADLGSVGDSLRVLSETPGSADEEATALRFAVGQVRAVADSADVAAPQADLRLFLAAEMARDSLGAPALAATLFRRIVEESPGSPYAPKALLAAQQLDTSWADTARALLAERYADSPYLALLRGEDAPGYKLLEDSLRTFAAAQAVPRRTGRVQRRPVEREREPEVIRRRRPGVTDSLNAPDQPTRRPRLEP